MSDLVGGLVFWGALALVALIALGALVALVAVPLAAARGARRARIERSAGPGESPADAGPLPR